jgi:hypothetical protein
MPSLDYMRTETATVWTDTGGDKLLNLNSMTGSGTVKMGAYLDLGAGSKADTYELEVVINGFDSVHSASDLVEVWFAQSDDATAFDGQPTTAPTATVQGTITSGQIRNCLPLGSLKAVGTAAAGVLQKRFIVKLVGRYVAPIIVNNSTFSLGASAHSLTLTPVPSEGQ